MSSKRSQPAKKLPLATQYRFWSSAGACAGSAVPSSTDCDEGEPPRLSLACRIRTARRKARSVSRWRGAKLQVMYPATAAQNTTTHCSGVPPATEEAAGAAPRQCLWQEAQKWPRSRNPDSLVEIDSFVAMFSTAIKPSADNYALFREDHEHIVKFDTSLHR